MKKIIFLIVIILLILNIYLTYNLFKIKENFSKKDPLIIENNVNGFHTDLTKAFKEVNQEMVYIQTVNTLGSGFIYKQDNKQVYIVTSFHNIKDHQNFTVNLYNNNFVLGDLVGYDEVLDLAVIKIELDYQVPVVKIGNSDLIRQGEYVIAVGVVEEIEFKDSLNLGVVSNASKNIIRNLKNDDYLVEFILTSINMGKGFSGGPLYNQAKELIGINNYHIKNNQNYSLAIPINEAVVVIEEIIKNKEVKRIGFEIDGIAIKDMDNILKSNFDLELTNDKGIYVRNVLNYFKKAEIMKGDIILNINDIEINSVSDLRIFNYNHSQELKIKLIRNNEEFVLEVKLDD